MDTIENDGLEAGVPKKGVEWPRTSSGVPKTVVYGLGSVFPYCIFLFSSSSHLQIPEKGIEVQELIVFKPGLRTLKLSFP